MQRHGLSTDHGERFAMSPFWHVPDLLRCPMSAVWLRSVGKRKQTFAEIDPRVTPKLSIQMQAYNFYCATRAGRNPKAEVMQFDDRGDHTQAQPQAFGVSGFV